MARVKCSLPEELIIEILYWLPVVSLLRLRSVCKSWLAIISDPKFIKTHSHHGKIMANKKASLLMVTNCDCTDQFRFFAYPDFNYYLLEPGLFKVIGSCNGIICLQEYYNLFHLWNPVTKQGKRLPISPMIEGAFLPSVKLAFGLDIISDDYKIIKFLSPTITTNVAPVLVQLYSTNTGSWKEIYVQDTSVQEVLSYQLLQLGPVIRGVLYMCRKEKLVSFNLHTEMFSVVAFPDSMSRYSEVLDFEGSVAVIYESSGEGSGISLWTLKDNCGEVSWTKKFTVRDDIRWAYSYLGGGVLYGRGVRNRRNHILYAYTKKEFNQPDENYCAVHKYTESLVSIEGFEPVPELPTGRITV